MADQGGGWIQMEFILIMLAATAVLVAVVTWSRRGQSSIGREAGEGLDEKRPWGGSNPPPGSPGDWTF